MTSKLRILHVVPSYLPAVRYGGSIFAVHGLCRALVARGHEVEVFTTNVDGEGDSSVPLNIPVMLDGVQVRYFPSTILRRLYWSPTMTRALHANMASFTAVHLHSVFLWPTWKAARSARNAEVPYLISPHGMLVRELIERRNRLIKLAWIQLIEKQNLEGASSIHVTSILEREQLEHFGWSLPRIATIPNGVNEVQQFSISDVSAEVRQLTTRRPFVLFFGRITWKKGLDRLLHAFAHTQVKSLVVVGPDDEALTPRLMKLAKNLHIADRVKFLTRTVIGADKEYLYQSASAFVLPSFSENFGISVLEAMLRAVPVVVTPEVGAAEIVRVSGGGIVITGEAESFGAAISRLVADPVLAQSMGLAGQRHVMAHYLWAGVAARMENLYEELRATLRS